MGLGLLLTGAFHEDGLADTADALGGALDRARIFEISGQPHRRVRRGGADRGPRAARRPARAARCRGARRPRADRSALSRTPPIWLMVALPYVTQSGPRSRPVAQAALPQALLGSLWPALALAAAHAAGALTAAEAAGMLVAAAAAAAILAAPAFTPAPAAHGRLPGRCAADRRVRRAARPRARAGRLAAGARAWIPSPGTASLIAFRHAPVALSRRLLRPPRRRRGAPPDAAAAAIERALHELCVRPGAVWSSPLSCCARPAAEPAARLGVPRDDGRSPPRDLLRRVGARLLGHRARRPGRVRRVARRLGARRTASGASRGRSRSSPGCGRSGARSAARTARTSRPARARTSWSRTPGCCARLRVVARGASWPAAMSARVLTSRPSASLSPSALSLADP